MSKTNLSQRQTKLLYALFWL